MAVANAAPITAMTGNVPIAIAYGNGLGAPAGFLVATVVLTLFSVGFVEMAKHITTAGAFYGFISHGLGQVWGMAAGVLATMAYVVFEGSLVGIFRYFASDALDSWFGWSVDWLVLAALCIAVIAVFGYFDISLAAAVLGVFLVCEVVLLAALAVSVLLEGGGPDCLLASSVDPLEAFGSASAGGGYDVEVAGESLAAGSAAIGLFFAFWSWVGFESTAMYGEESRNPKRIIPRATLIAVLGVGIFYIFVSWMAVAGSGLSQSVKLAQTDAFAVFFNPTRQFVGGWAVVLFQWLILTGSFACGLAFHNCAARYLYAIGREGFISRSLGKTHPTHGSPYVASFVQTGIAAVIIALFWIAGQDPYLGLYALMAILGTFAILIVQTICSFAVIGYFRKNHPEARHWFTTFLAPLLGGIGMASVVVLLLLNASTAAGDASETLLFKLIPWIVVGVFLAGVALALYLRSSNPERYRTIGRIIYEDTMERPDVDIDGDGRGDHAVDPARP